MVAPRPVGSGGAVLGAAQERVGDAWVLLQCCIRQAGEVRQCCVEGAWEGVRAVRASGQCCVGVDLRQ